VSHSVVPVLPALSIMDGRDGRNADFLTSWITDPDGNRIEQTQPEDTPPR
jgi:hypothetical protein